MYACSFKYYCFRDSAEIRFGGGCSDSPTLNECSKSVSAKTCSAPQLSWEHKEPNLTYLNLPLLNTEPLYTSPKGTSHSLSENLKRKGI